MRPDPATVVTARSVRVGVIGCGYWGPNLVRNFARHPHSQVEAVCDLRYERAMRVGAEYRIPTITDRVDEVLKAPDVDLVVVATPSFTHFELAKRALEAGKHVLVMKPLATRTDHAEELCAVAERQGVLLAVDHTFVFTDAVRKMHQLISTGEIGDLYYFDSVRINLGLFQSDVSVIWDLAVHDLSIMDYILADNPLAVAATGAAHLRGHPANMAYLTCFFGDDLIAHHHVNWLAPVKVRRTLIGGDRQMIMYDDLEPSEKVKLYDKGITLRSGQERIYESLVGYRTGDMWAPKVSLTEGLHTEAQHFVECIRNGVPPLTSGAAAAQGCRGTAAGTRGRSG